MVFETDLLEIEGHRIRTLIRQPDIDEARCYFICRKCASHTYMTTQWIGYRLYGSEDAAVDWVGDDPIPANNKRITPATQRAAWEPDPDDDGSFDVIDTVNIH
jgi:hypothetical protein